MGVVLEELVEARSAKHYESVATEREDVDEEVKELFEEAQEESAEHRARLEALINQLDAETVPFDQIEQLVITKYGQTKPEDFDDILYDQLHGEETAYKFYDDLIGVIENSKVNFGVDRNELLETLREIRAEEAEGVEEVTHVMEESA